MKTSAETTEQRSIEQIIDEALVTCASEPIHIPGSIQPYGALLIATQKTYKIIGCSENAGQILGIDQQSLQTKTLREILPEEKIKQLESLLQPDSTQTTRTQRVQVSGMWFDLTAHISGKDIILEFEVADVNQDISNDDFFYNELRTFSKGLRETESTSGLFDIVVKHVCDITAIDSVKLYKFDEDWNGHVIAEARTSDAVPSYKGLHFPHSDIPEQARILYSKNYIRTISDVDYIPSPIVRFDGSDKPVDLSFSVLRSVSPVHIQYLKNMNVCASMSISIMQGGKLWGLIACHHLSPKYLSPRKRMISELMGHMFSTLLSSFSQMEAREDEANRRVLLQRLTLSWSKGKNVIEDNALALIEVLKANGFAYSVDGNVKVIGACPQKDALTALTDFLSKRKHIEIFQTDNADVELILPARPPGTISGGVLAIPIGSSGKDYIMWFRQPEIVGVTWAGKPEKNIKETVSGYRLTPRSSFALWREIVKNRALPWNEIDVSTAQAIARLIAENQSS